MNYGFHAKLVSIHLEFLHRNVLFYLPVVDIDASGLNPENLWIIVHILFCFSRWSYQNCIYRETSVQACWDKFQVCPNDDWYWIMFCLSGRQNIWTIIRVRSFSPEWENMFGVTLRWSQESTGSRVQASKRCGGGYRGLALLKCKYSWSIQVIVVQLLYDTDNGDML